MQAAILEANDTYDFFASTQPKALIAGAPERLSTASSAATSEAIKMEFEAMWFFSRGEAEAAETVLHWRLLVTDFLINERRSDGTRLELDF